MMDANTYACTAALADYAVGKTVDELKGMAVGEDGKAADADLAASVTLYIGSFVDGIEAARAAVERSLA